MVRRASVKSALRRHVGGALQRVQPVNVLAIETSSDQLSLALAYAGSLRSVDRIVGNRHAELVLPEIEQLLEEAGANIASLDAIVILAQEQPHTAQVSCYICHRSSPFRRKSVQHFNRSQKKNTHHATIYSGSP